ncbi:MAG: complex I subunit 5 family protein [Lachnospiraceae bacterium]|nr:complex I subunit 5 family protein [Lachnospiraceae bacterium]
MERSALLSLLILWPIAASIAGYFLGRKTRAGRDVWSVFTCLSELALIIGLFIKRVACGTDLYFDMDGICGMGLHFVLDGFRSIYGIVCVLMWTATAAFSVQYLAHYRNRNRYHMFNLMTLGATMGVFLASDLFTAFIFFEMMSFTSFVWVAHDETPEAMRAACTYLAVAIIGGLVTLMGLFLLHQTIGTLTLSEIPAAIENIRRSWLLATPPYDTGIVTHSRLYITGGLLAFGFAAKAGVWPLHIWLPKAHPVAPAPASALLSGILTKSGVFGILAITCNMFLGDIAWGRAVLILGTITMFTGALLAVLSVNLKRTLACSSMSQIGFIMVGTGMYSILGETGMIAARGTILHMVNHSLIKLVLFMAAGVIYMNIHKLDLNEIRGYGRKKPLLAICFAIGAASISGIPLTSGYISKTLLHESIALPVVEWIFLISGGMTLSYMLKLFMTIFVHKNEDDSVQAEYDSQTGYWNNVSRSAVVIPAVLLFLLGVLPYLLMDRISALCAPFMGADPAEIMAERVAYFSWENLSGALISIAIGLCLYFFVIRYTYTDRWPKKLDLEDLIYRPLILKVIPGVLGFVSAITGQITDAFIIIMRRTLFRQISTHIATGSLDDHLAVELGSVMDKIHPNPDGKSHIPKYVEKEERVARTQRVIYSSLSFGLILVCIGLILVLIYTLTAA